MLTYHSGIKLIPLNIAHDRVSPRFALAMIGSASAGLWSTIWVVIHYLF